MPVGNLLKYWDPSGTPANRVARTNLMNNPRAINTAAGGWVTTWSFGPSGAGTYAFGTAITGPSGTGIVSCRRKTWTTAPSSNVGSGFEIRPSSTAYFPCTPGDVLTVSAYLRISNSGTSKLGFADVQFFDRTAVAGAVTVGVSQTGPTAALALGLWSRVSHTVTVPAGAAGFRLVADIATGGLWAVGNQLECTGAMIEKVAALDTFFDGGSTDTQSFEYDWVGTADDSSSTADPWKPVLSPAGLTGPQGSVGTSVVRPSAGGCSFYGSLASYTSGAGWVPMANLRINPGCMDLNPCFTVRADGLALTVARTGTILVSFQASLGGGSFAGWLPSSSTGIGDAPYAHRYTWPVVYEDNNSLSAILPNVPAGTDVPFWVLFTMSPTVNPVYAYINAAMIQ